MSPAPAAVDWASVALTPLEAGDLDRLNAWQNDPEIIDLTMGFRGPVSRETTAEWITKVTDEHLKARAVFAIRRGATIVGVVQLQAIDWVQRTATLGVYVGEPGDRGAGLGRAAVCLLLDYAFNGLDLHRIGLEVIASNPAARLYESLGFQREGIRREPYLRDGAREDVLLYGLLKDNWITVLPDAARRLA